MANMMFQPRRALGAIEPNHPAPTQNCPHIKNCRVLPPTWNATTYVRRNDPYRPVRFLPPMDAFYYAYSTTHCCLANMEGITPSAMDTSSVLNASTNYAPSEHQSHPSPREPSPPSCKSDLSVAMLRAIERQQLSVQVGKTCPVKRREPVPWLFDDSIEHGTSTPPRSDSGDEDDDNDKSLADEAEERQPAAPQPQVKVFVQFPCHVEWYACPAAVADELRTGDPVIVAGDRGHDLGTVANVDRDPKERIAESTVDRVIVRRANLSEVESSFEMMKFSVANTGKIAAIVRANTKVDGVEFLGCEFRLDGSKLSVYYWAPSRLPFAEAVRVLHAKYGCRVQMIQVNYNTVGPSKKTK